MNFSYINSKSASLLILIILTLLSLSFFMVYILRSLFRKNLCFVFCLKYILLFLTYCRPNLYNKEYVYYIMNIKKMIEESVESLQ